MKAEDVVYSPRRVCGYCVLGHRVNPQAAIHLPSQRKGMIAEAPCRAVQAGHVGSATEVNARPWVAYVNGRRVVNRDGVPLRYASQTAAERVALRVFNNLISDDGFPYDMFAAEPKE